MSRHFRECAFRSRAVQVNTPLFVDISQLFFWRPWNSQVIFFWPRRAREAILEAIYMLFGDVSVRKPFQSSKLVLLGTVLGSIFNHFWLLFGTPFELLFGVVAEPLFLSFPYVFVFILGGFP